MSEPVLNISDLSVKWTPKERDLWMDLFVNYCEIIMGATLEENTGLRKYPEDQLKSDISLSADLADHAIREVQFRMNAKYTAHEKRRDTSVRMPRRASR